MLLEASKITGLFQPAVEETWAEVNVFRTLVLLQMNGNAWEPESSNRTFVECPYLLMFKFFIRAPGALA